MAYPTSIKQQEQNQLMVIAMAMFGAVVAAIVVSTLLVLSLMRGEIAGAISEVNTNAPTTQNVSGGSGVCTGTSSPEVSGSGASASGAGYSHRAWGSVSNSYNNTITSSVVTNTTENNSTANSVVTTLTDSFNVGSYNDVNSNNDLDVDSHDVTVTSVTTNVNSNNDIDVNSGNTINNDNDVVDVL